MNDDFLHNHRKTPPPDFAAKLRQQLDEEGARMTTQSIPFTTEAQRTQSNHRANGQGNLTPQPLPHMEKGLGGAQRAPGVRVDSVSSSHITRRVPTRPSLTLAVALAAMVALISVVIIGRTPPNITPLRATLPPLVPITTENAAQVQPISTIGKGNLYQVAYSPDGETLALAGVRGAWLHNTADLTAPARLLEGDDTGFIERVLAWSPDGSLLAMSNRDSARVWNPVTGAVIVDLEYSSTVTALAFSPDGDELVVGGGDWDDPAGTTYPVQLWKTQTWQQDQTPVQLGGRVTSLAFQPGDDRLLAIAFDLSADAPTWSLMLMRTADKSLQWNAYFDEEGGQALAFSQDGQIIYSDHGNRIVGWNVETGEQVSESPTLPNPTYDGSLAINRAATEMAISSVNGGLKIWPLTGDTTRFQTSEAQSSLNYTTSVEYSPDGSQLVTLEYDGLVQIWDAETGEEVAAIRDYAGSISAVKLTPDQQQAFVADQTGALRFYDLNSGEEIRRFDTHTNLFGNLADLSVDGTRIAHSNIRIHPVDSAFQSAGGTGITLLDALTGLPQSGIDTSSTVTGAVQFSPDGSSVLINSLNGSGLWDITQPDEPVSLFSRSVSSNTAAFSPDSQFLAFSDLVGTAARLVIFDLLKPEQIYFGAIPGTEDSSSTYVSVLAWSPDGSTIALPFNGVESEPQYTVRLFDVESQTFTQTQEAADYLYDLTYSPDGSVLAATVNGQVNLYDATTLDLLAELPRTAAYLVTFSADGSMLLTGGWDGIVRVWGVPG
jgi:WD40 repeat protein